MCESLKQGQLSLDFCGLVIRDITTGKIEDKIGSVMYNIRKYDPSILRLLLKDKTTGKNIMWCTNTYVENGIGYDMYDEITPMLITGVNNNLIQPRTTKLRNVQQERTRDRAEVFTPSWVCNKQNNIIDTKWFGYEDVFNKEVNNGWETTIGKVKFPSENKNWKKYVDAQRLEITCGEAPYLISRYDTVTGKIIPLCERIGLFDRKMRVVNENAIGDEEWVNWSIRAVESVFGYEYQGDNLLIARENLFYSYLDYYQARFISTPDKVLIKKIANIITWNIWQMDGLKFIVPNSCNGINAERQITLFDSFLDDEQYNYSKDDCQGCNLGDITRHNGIYCKIKDWRANESVLFVNMMRGWKG